MIRLRAALLRLAGLFNRQGRDRDFADEIAAHLRMHIDDHLRAGMTPEEARRKALLKLGGVEQTRERYQDQRGVPVLEHVGQDLRYALRLARSNPVRRPSSS